MGEVVTQTVSYEKWPPEKPVFETVEDFYVCHKDLGEKGYRAEVKTWPNGETQVYRLEANIDPNINVQVEFGMVVVLFGGVLESMTPERLEQRFS